jgi:hypothetical protein
MPQPAYHALLSQIRQAFPQPVSDRMHDSYFVFSIMRALDQVDAMKSKAPLLGRKQELDYAAAQAERIGEDSTSVEAVSQKLVARLEGMPIWGHPLTQINVVAPPRGWALEAKSTATSELPPAPFRRRRTGPRTTGGSLCLLSS